METLILEDLEIIINTVKSKKTSIKNKSMYLEFERVKIRSNFTFNVHGGGIDGGRKEHGEPHFELFFDNIKYEMYIPNYNDINIPNKFDINYKSEIELPKKYHKKLKKLLINNDNLLKIAQIWNKLNKDNTNKNIHLVKWATSTK